METFGDAYQDMRDGKPARAPIVEIGIPTIYDSTLTLRDGHVLSIWVPFAPPELSEGTRDPRREPVGNDPIDYVSRYIPIFEPRSWTGFSLLLTISETAWG